MKHKHCNEKDGFTLPVIFDKFEKQYNILKEKLGLKNEIGLFFRENEKSKK